MHLDRTELQLLLLAARLGTELARAPAMIVGACEGAHAPPGDRR
jgi:hypothetical protein